ncbi:MAG: UDP-3-O-(3-hydroxymyristoyl)glucosamine N-acyltransferase [Gammaproteobacteria bacterium]|nr:MAG: UDP-3-O-(3-hydroxymyristoyl)glucosamine N-acyltransferase [Gammaproteobacteria bacterium]
MPYRLAELAERFGCQLHGDGDISIATVCTLQAGKPEAISFLANKKYFRYLSSTTAAAVILKPENADKCPVPVLSHENPYACYARIAQFLSESTDDHAVEIHPTAIVHPTATVGKEVSIGPYSVIEENAVIGDGCFIGPGVVISAGAQLGQGSILYSNISVYKDCIIGKYAILHAGAVIGSDGFGIAQDEGEWVKVPQLGRVVIGDHVEIGASTTVDRGAIDDTVIEDGVKLDNQVQIGHNVHLGAHSAIAGCSGVAGSTTIGKRCTIGAMTAVLGHIELADDVHITAKSMVTKSIPESGVYSSGTPLQPNIQWRRNFTRFGQLDEIAKRLKKLEKFINDD